MENYNISAKQEDWGSDIFSTSFRFHTSKGHYDQACVWYPVAG